jgi:hypothetical protein
VVALENCATYQKSKMDLTRFDPITFPDFDQRYELLEYAQNSTVKPPVNATLGFHVP